MNFIAISGSSRYDEFLIVSHDDLETPSDEKCEQDAESIHQAFLAGIPAKTWNLVLEKMTKYHQEHDDI